MKKAQKRFLGTALTLSTVASIVAPVAVSAATVTFAEAKAKVDAAKAVPTFKAFNEAYALVIGLSSKDDQAKLLNELSPLWSKVATKYVTDILGEMDKLAKDKNLKTYNELLAKIEANTDNTEATNKNYLLGELTAWGQSGALYTTEEKAAIDAIVKAWTDKTPANVQAAKDATAKVKNAGSLEWLNGEIGKISAQMKTSITSIKATGEKTLEVTFNKAVADTTKMVLTLKKDTATAAISEVKWNTDKTVATLTLGAKITEAKYQVTAKYDTEEAVTSEVLSLKDAEASKIEILSTRLTMASSTSADDDAATFRIRITNQYGEDITDKVSTGDLKVKASSGDWDGKIGDDGLIRLEGNFTDGDDEFDVNDQVSVTVTYKPTAVISTKTLTVVDAAAVASIVIGDLTPYDKDDKDPIRASKTIADDYYLPLTVKDEDGNVLTYDELIDALDDASSSNDDIFDIKEDPADFLKDLGDKKIGIKLVNTNGESGKTVVSITSETGVVGSKTITVDSAVAIDKLTFNAPSVTVKEGKEFVLTFTAYDQYGNQLIDEADFPTISDDKTTSKKIVFLDDEGEEGTEIEIDGGTIQTQIDYSNNNALQLVVTPIAGEDEIVVSVDTATRKSSEITLKVEEEAYAENIASVSSSFIPTVLFDANVKTATGSVDTVATEFKTSHLSLKDQYGDAIVLEGFTFGTINNKYEYTKTVGSTTTVIDKEAYDLLVNNLPEGTTVNAKIVSQTIEYTKTVASKTDSGLENGDVLTYKVIYEIEDASKFQISKVSNTGTKKNVDERLEFKAVGLGSTDLNIKLVQVQYDKKATGNEIVDELDTETVTLKSIDLSDITGYTVDAFGKLYVGDETDKYGMDDTTYNDSKKEVFGLLDSKKVKVPQQLIVASSLVTNVTGIKATVIKEVAFETITPETVTTPAGIYIYTTGTDRDNEKIDTDGADKTGKVTFTVRGSGNKTYTVSKDFTYSDAAPLVSSWEVRDEYDNKLTASNYTFNIAELDGNVTSATGNYSVVTKVDGTRAGIRFYSKDQYGKELKTGVRLTIASFKDADNDNSFAPAINNGLLDLSGAEAGDVFTIIANTEESSKTITITLK